MVKYRWIRAIFSLTVVYQQVNTLEVSASFRNPDDNVIGKTAVFQCNWTTGESFSGLNLSSSSNTLFECTSNGTVHCLKGSTASSRHVINSTTLGSISMTIENLICSDEGTYDCTIDVKQPKVSSSTLKLKVLPSPPKLSDARVSVPVNKNITATCTAVVGYPTPLDIVWKTFKNGQLVDLSTKLIVTSVSKSEPGDDNCTVRKQSTAHLVAEQDFQDLILACFVRNQDLQTSTRFCENQIKDLCNQTKPVTVVQSGGTSSLATDSATSTTVTTDGTSSIDCEVSRLRCQSPCPEPDCYSFLLLVTAAILSLMIVCMLIFIVVLIKRIKRIKGTAKTGSKKVKPNVLKVEETGGLTPV